MEIRAQGAARVMAYPRGGTRTDGGGHSRWRVLRGKWTSQARAREDFREHFSVLGLLRYTSEGCRRHA